MYHISCQTTVILAVFEFSCLFSYMIQYLYIYIQRDRFLHVLLAQTSAGLAGVSSEMGLDDGLLVCTLLLLI